MKSKLTKKSKGAARIGSSALVRVFLTLFLLLNFSQVGIYGFENLDKAGVVRCRNANTGYDVWHGFDVLVDSVNMAAASLPQFQRDLHSQVSPLLCGLLLSGEPRCENGGNAGEQSAEDDHEGFVHRMVLVCVGGVLGLLVAVVVNCWPERPQAQRRRDRDVSSSQ